MNAPRGLERRVAKRQPNPAALVVPTDDFRIDAHGHAGVVGQVEDHVQSGTYLEVAAGPDGEPEGREVPGELKEALVAEPLLDVDLDGEARGGPALARQAAVWRVPIAPRLQGPQRDLQPAPY